MISVKISDSNACSEEFDIKITGIEVAIAVAALNHAMEGMHADEHLKYRFRNVHNKIVDQVNEQHNERKRQEKASQEAEAPTTLNRPH